jgi:hypothetical protein
MLQYSIEGVLLAFGFAACFTVAMLFFGSFTVGTFQRLRDRKSRIFEPLLDMLKNVTKKSSSQATTSITARRLVLFAWILSTFTAFFFLPWGSISIFALTPLENGLGNFQLFAVFGLLMVYPVGLMILCFVSQRKAAILNLKFMAEDFFSNFITFLVVAFSLLILANNGFSFTGFPSIADLITMQAQETINGIVFPGFFGLQNPLALIAFCSIIPIVFDPIEFSDDPLLKKWTPLVDFTGGSLAWVKTIKFFRFITLLAFIVDIFAGGARFTAIWYIDVPLFFIIVLLLAALLSVVKRRRSTWVLDKKIFGFLRAHTLIAIAGLVLSIVLIYS